MADLAHRPGCEALGGYGHGVGPCACGAVTPQQLELLHHTLGLRVDRREPYRDYFVAGHGHHDMPDLEALEAAGLMERRRRPKFLDQDDVVFGCTAAGRAYAIEHLAQPPKLTRSQKRYQNWLDEDCSMRFGEWLKSSPRP